VGVVFFVFSRTVFCYIFSYRKKLRATSQPYQTDVTMTGPIRAQEREVVTLPGRQLLMPENGIQRRTKGFFTYNFSFCLQHRILCVWSATPGYLRFNVVESADER